MPFPEPFLPIILIATLIFGFSMWLFNTFGSISSKIREAHTQFTISQMVSHLSELDVTAIPRSEVDLISTLKESRIDWNSCRIESDRILDGWRQPMNVTFDESKGRWVFLSSGRDGKFGTADDIDESHSKKSQGEQDATGLPATRPKSK